MARIIENPVINSPFAEPQRHYLFDDGGITDEIQTGRRPSEYLVPVPGPKKKTQQLMLMPQQRRESRFINQIRDKVKQWRLNGYKGATRTSQKLLEHWQDTQRERKLFFCQLEALETAIFIGEVASKLGEQWINNGLREYADEHNPGLIRIALKMATGSGKTVVMAMLITWQTLNKQAHPQDGRFSDSFLVVTPGITIKDRLRVLQPNAYGNYYDALDLVPEHLRDKLNRAKVVVTNYHAFMPRTRVSLNQVQKAALGAANAEPGIFTESPDQMARRVCKGLDGKRGIIVLNDEAHHCYRGKGEGEKLTGEDLAEAKRNNEAARVWLSGLEAIKGKYGIRAVYDLSATPFFLRGSGFPEGTLFPWVVTDFSLVDAIESGIVKVPRVPVSDNAMSDEAPVYLNLWPRIRDKLPKKGRATEAIHGEPKLPEELEGALKSLYDHYERHFKAWLGDREDVERGSCPPVFIVVCNNTNVSNLVFRHIAGWEKELAEGAKVPVPGQLPLLSNVVSNQWLQRQRTILIDSAQLDSPEAMSPEFKKLAAQEIMEFREEYRQRFPERDLAQLADEDILREVMNTVGKPGLLGEQVRCVVSVSMLTEGWDANTVTHVMGVRAFGTQLLCEQVVGRALRRSSYVPEQITIDVNGEELSFEGFPAEYADVYGVPFSFIPCAAASPLPRVAKPTTRVQALPDRRAAMVRFPKVLGYRFDIDADKLHYEFGDDCRIVLDTHDVPTQTDVSGLVGLPEIHTLDSMKEARLQQVAFHIAKEVLLRHFPDDEGRAADGNGSKVATGTPRLHLFPQVLAIAREWLTTPGMVDCHDDAFPQLLLLAEKRVKAADKVQLAIVGSDRGRERLLPILWPYEFEGSTNHIDFNTTKLTYATSAKSHVDHVVLDSGWEAKLANALEGMDEVVAYVKNQHLGFTIPYVWQDDERSYYPDFLARVRRPDWPAGVELNLIIEVSGAQRDYAEAKETKVTTARNYWVPAVNNSRRFGRWAFIEITDPWNAKTELRALFDSQDWLDEQIEIEEVASATA